MAKSFNFGMYFAYLLVACCFHTVVLNQELASRNNRDISNGKSASRPILMPDLLNHLEAKQIEKRNVENKDGIKSSSKTSSKKLLKKNLNLPIRTASKQHRKLNATKNFASSVPKKKMFTKLGSKIKTFRSFHSSRRKVKLRKKIKTAARNKDQFKSKHPGKAKKQLHKTHIGKMRKNLNSKKRESKVKWKKIIHKFEKQSQKGLVRQEHSDEQENKIITQRHTIPLHGYHLVRAPIAGIYAPYPLRVFSAPRYLRDRIYYARPYYDRANYARPYYDDDYDRYYDDRRRDVIPKPILAPGLVRGAKKESFFKEKSHKRTAYAPIVSAVQNLDQSEANLFDSLLSTSHETNALTEDVGSELSNFAGSPSDLEVYTPTDTPGELYFEKDKNEGNSRDFSQEFTEAPTTKSTDPEADASDIMDNEEKLLTMVEKVIDKQKRKKDAEKLKLKTGGSQTDDSKAQNTFAIGDTSEVFGQPGVSKVFHTSHPQIATIAKSQFRSKNLTPQDKNKLQDFLSKQPKFEKKLKAMKAKNKPRVQDNRNLKSTKKLSAKGHGSEVRVQSARQSTKEKNQSDKFKIDKSGQRVIVESLNPKNDNLLLESLKAANVNENEKQIHAVKSKKINSLPKKHDETENHGAAVATESDGDNHWPHVIKETANENGDESTIVEPKENAFVNNERHNGFETIPLSNSQSGASKYTINENPMQIGLQQNPYDWFSNEPKTSGHVTISADKKDDDKTEAEATEKEDSEKEAAEKKPDEKEAKEKDGSDKEAGSKENEKEPDKTAKEEPAPKEDPKVTEPAKSEESKETAEGTQKPAEDDKKPAESGATEPPKEESKEHEIDVFDWFKTNNTASVQPTVPTVVQSPLPVGEPPHIQVESHTPPPANQQIPGWRIRDYYLDQNNASNWEQIRSAWTNRNGSNFIFNNKINVNPNYNPNAPATLPPIRFVGGATMPTLPTMPAPTGIPMQGFPNENDDDDDDLPGQTQHMQAQHQQQISQQQQQQQQVPVQQPPATTLAPFGLRYPWQWNNRRPAGGRYQEARLQFHGRVTRPTYQPLVVTTKNPVVGGPSLLITRPTAAEATPPKVDPLNSGNMTVEASTHKENDGFSQGQETAKQTEEQNGGKQDKNSAGNAEEKLKESPTEEKAGESAEGAAQESAKTVDKNTGDTFKETNDGTTNKEDTKGESAKENKEGNAEESTKESKTPSKEVEKGGEGKSNANLKDDSVLVESMTHKNMTSRRLTEMEIVPGKTQGNLGVVPAKEQGNVAHSSLSYKPIVQGSSFSEERLPQTNITSWTEAPKELPILSEPTTKSVQSFLPGVRPPFLPNNRAPSDRKSVYPVRTDSYDEQMNKYGLRKAEGGSDTGNVRSKGMDNGESSDNSEKNQVIMEESTNRLLDDGKGNNTRYVETDKEESDSRASFAFESNLLQKEETENAEARARVDDTPINRQAESVNKIRHQTSASQRAAQRQQVAKDNSTETGYTVHVHDRQAYASPSQGPKESTPREQTSPFMIRQGNGNNSQNINIRPPVNYKVHMFIQPETKQENRPFTNIPPTTTPSTTATTPSTPGYDSIMHHPTPKPLFLPVQFRPLTTSKANSQGTNVQENRESPQNEQGGSNSVGNNQSATYQKYYTANQQSQNTGVIYGPTQTTSGSTTPGVIGYKTTDWAKAFASNADTRPAKSQPIVQTPQTNLVADSSLKSEAQLPIYQTANNSVASNEGRYQTDTATMRTTPKVTGQVQGVQTSNQNTLTYGEKTHAFVYPNAGYANVPTYASSNNALNQYGTSANVPSFGYGLTSSWSGMKSPQNQMTSAKPADILSDSYLSKFGDQLNMEDLYWTDSTEEKENICKQEKGTNEVVHVLCFGDSLTRGYYNKGKSHHPYTNKLQLLLNKLDTKKCYIIENEGKDGEMAYEEMPKRLETIFKEGERKYDWTIILGGTNDIYNKKKKKPVTEEEITHDIIAMHEIAQQHKSKSVAVTIPEVYCETQDTCQDAKQLRERVNYNIRNYALQNSDNVVLVDLADMLQRSNVGKDMVAQFFEGGLHLKPRGYERMAIIIFEGLKKALS